MEGVFRADEQALLWINSHHSPVLDALLAPVSLAGEFGAIWILVALILIAFGRGGDRTTGLALLLTIAVTDRLVAVPLAHAFFRERPYLALEGIRQIGPAWKGSSFPSGHADTVWIAAVILADRWPRLRTPLVAFALLTCYARPYFGMHYPSDVIAGSALGAAAGSLTVFIQRARQGRRRPEP